MKNSPHTELDDPIALFPLQTVLYPDGLLPLRIFEPRYLDMVSDSMRGAAPFGIVPIKFGRETGNTPHFFPLGTLASIVSWDQGDDGLLHVVVRGGEMFSVARHDIRPNGLLVADVEFLEAPPDSPMPDRYEYLGELLREIFESNLERIIHEDWHMNSSLWVAHRLAETLPLEISDKVDILGSPTSEDKLSRIHAYLSGLRNELQNTPRR